MKDLIYFAMAFAGAQAFAQHDMSKNLKGLAHADEVKWSYHCTLSVKPTDDIEKRKALGPSYISADFIPQKFDFSGENKDVVVKKVKEAFEAYKHKSSTYDDVIAEKSLECSRCSAPEVEPF